MFRVGSTNSSTHTRNALVGECPIVEIQVNNQTVWCLVDTGSQLTLFSESLCNELFGQLQVQGSKISWLTLRAANRLDIPYVGCLITNFQVQGVQVPEKGIVNVKDHCLGAQRALLGMNVLAGCWEDLFQGGSPTRTRPTTTPEDQEWEPVIADCRRIQTALAHQERTDTDRAACRYAITIPVCSE